METAQSAGSIQVYSSLYEGLSSHGVFKHRHGGKPGESHEEAESWHESLHESVRGTLCESMHESVRVCS